VAGPEVYATARTAAALYAAAIILIFTHRTAVARILWMAGALLMAVHVGLAFDRVHAWDHAAAVAETARQTGEAVGWFWGGGVYVNYLFLLVWTADAAWWCLAPAQYVRRSRRLAFAIHAFLAFILFNAVVVFADGPTRWVGIIITLILLILFGVSRCRGS
jgi:hypothetical protein